MFLDITSVTPPVAPRDGTVTSISARRTLGLGKVEQTFSRCLFGVMPAFVPVNTEMTKDPVSDLKGSQSRKESRMSKSKMHYALVEICVESKKNQVERNLLEAQRYRGQCAEDGQGAERLSQYHFGFGTKSDLFRVRKVCLA